MRQTAGLLIVCATLFACGDHATSAQALAPASANATTPDAPCRSLDLPAAKLSSDADWKFPEPAAGSQRLAKPEGGWTLLHPSSWWTLDDRLRGAQVLSFRPNPASLTSQPQPSGQIILHVEALPNEERLDLDRYLDKMYPAGLPGATNEVHARTATTLSGQHAVTITAVAKVGPPPYVEQRLWFVASPYFDRIYKLWISPSDTSRLGEVENIVASFTMLPPTRTSPSMTVTAADAIARVMARDKAGALPPFQVKATKLVREWDLSAATGAYTYGSGNDPDNLIWLVSVVGRIEVDYTGFRGLHQPPPTPVGGFTWALYTISASAAPNATPSRFEWGTTTDWPPRYASLKDRCIR